MSEGRVEQIWRYPVKSMGGERLEAVGVTTGGLPGDRAWAVRDEVRGGIRGAKKIPSLMRCKARYPLPPTQGGDMAEITLPDGSRVTTHDPDAAKRLSDALGQEVTLWPLQPAHRLEHYRRGAPTHSDVLKELRSVFGLLPDEPLPDLSVFPREVLEFETPPGTYFDAFPLLLMTDASLRTLQDRAPNSVIDVRRFRPNFLVAAPPQAEGFVEMAWPGRKLRIGAATLEVTIACPRCVMTTHGFDDLPRDTSIMRTLVREAAQKFGVYARVAQPGEVALGDTVELLD
ncbi:MAG TPA: MOSC N-terminal beta barrel domain-containing protein [Myxococcota bacterium]|nr:MOSC N-terminal beta barrel domain-containing protein [Myxococcota bacterium]